MQNIEDKQRILAAYGVTEEEFHRMEELRGKPIDLLDTAEQIPHKEICSPGLKAATPLVSVMMLAYNHEAFIAQAIEGVVSQQCSFPFELVIFEDCSPDKTLDICRDYQRRFPDKIRLYTPETNTRCRMADVLQRNLAFGKYLAWCEGDDYWTDIHKLQKQIDFLESHPDIGLCSTDYRIQWDTDGHVEEKHVLPAGQNIGNLYEEVFARDQFPQFQTAGIVIRATSYIRALREDFLFLCRLNCGDIQMQLEATKPSGRYGNIPELSYTYRRHAGGLSFGERQYQLVLDVFFSRYWMMKAIYPAANEDDLYLKFYFLGLKERIGLCCSSGNGDSFDSIRKKAIEGILRMASSLDMYPFALITLRRVVFMLSLASTPVQNTDNSSKFMNMQHAMGKALVSEMKKSKIPLFTQEHSLVTRCLGYLLPWSGVFAIYRFSKAFRALFK